MSDEERRRARGAWARQSCPIIRAKLDAAERAFLASLSEPRAT
jgi:hypothetical protein